MILLYSLLDPKLSVGRRGGLANSKIFVMGFCWFIDMLYVFDGDQGGDVIEINRIIIKFYFFYFRLHYVLSVLPVLCVSYLSA